MDTIKIAEDINRHRRFCVQRELRLAATANGL
jgi:hypothetical protein